MLTIANNLISLTVTTCRQNIVFGLHLSTMYTHSFVKQVVLTCIDQGIAPVAAKGRAEEDRGS